MNVRPACELSADFEDSKAVFLEMPPYLHYTLDETNRQRVSQIEHYRGTFDSFCVACDKESTFADTLPVPGNAPRLISSGSVNGGARVGSNSTTRQVPSKPKPIPDRSFSCSFRCTRDRDHLIEFHFRIYQGCLVKVGQFPSMADLRSYGLRKYRRILGDRHRELTKAVGLHAHGIGIGAFVYLRRIFESLVAAAHDKASASLEWDATRWVDSIRMDEKIRLLGAHLPAFLSENRMIYGILSKGVHELSEEECLSYFPVVREGIEAILDEKLAEQERQARRGRVSRTIAQLGKLDESKGS